MSAAMLKAPFPWFGGKSMVGPQVWARFGDVPNYVEPFFGSGAVLLGRPRFEGNRIETVNDLDGFVANFWRSVALSPEETAKWADWPVNENDLHARHIWLVGHREALQSRLEGDPDYHEPKIAGWWVWGLSAWIGGGWCSGKGPWSAVDGVLSKEGDAGQGIKRRRPHLGNAGQGINRQRPNLGNAGQGVHGSRGPDFSDLCDRLRRVRVCSGDWARVVTDAVILEQGTCGVFLDPPYADTADRDPDLYSKDSFTVAHDVRRWAVEHGENPMLRIALCGYEGEHIMPNSWECVPWKAKGGMNSRGGRAEENSHRERIWFSPHCLKPLKRQIGLFEEASDD